jgi:hypothetical protein
MATLQSAQAREPSMPRSTANGLCAMAVTFFKLVAERGVWDEDLLHDAEMAWLSETDRGKELAILKWWIAAERGFEIAQNNLAHVLDQGQSPVDRLPSCLRFNCIILQCQTRAFYGSLGFRRSHHQMIPLSWH